MSRLYYHYLEGFQALEHVLGLVGYSKRALVMAGHNDVVLIDCYLEDEEQLLPEIHLLNKLGFGPKRENIFLVHFSEGLSWEENYRNNAHVFQKLKPLQIACLFPFTGVSFICHQIAKELQIPIQAANPTISSWACSKVTFSEICTKENLAPRSLYVKDNQDIFVKWNQLKDMPNFSKLGVLKAPQSASGQGSSIFRSEEDIQKFILERDIAKWGGAVLSEWLESDIRSPSINFFIDKTGAIKEQFVSDQIFDDHLVEFGKEGTRIHRGNFFPSSFDDQLIDVLRQKALIFAKQLVKNGYMGPLGIDSIVLNNGTLLLCEANARITGPWYGWWPMREAGAQSFRSQIEKIKPLSFANVVDNMKDYIFNSTTKRGVVFFGEFPGKCISLVLGMTREEVAETSLLVDNRFKELLGDR